jgi:cyclase
MIHRVIPALLLRNGGLVKTTRFKDSKYVGDPINVIRIFNEKEVDELIVLDIDASRSNKDPNYELIEQLAGECFMPLAYGGGIKTISQARRLFSLGIEKICIQTEAINNPLFITQLSNEFGSQSIIASVDIKRSWLGKPKIYKSSGSHSLKGDWLNLLDKMVEAGAGEVLLNSVDKDGTLSGPDLQLIKSASERVGVPLVAVGGVSSLSDIKNCIDAGASAVAAGAFFVYHGPHRAVLITYPKNQDLEQLFKVSNEQ